MSEEIKERKVSYYRKPNDLTLDEWQIALRRQFALKQEFEVKNLTQEKVFSDFSIYNPKTNKTYKVAIRDYEFGLNFCNCPDFKINGLGTCKHIEYVLHQLKQNKANDKEWQKGYKPAYSSISLKYGIDRKVFLRIGEIAKQDLQQLAKDYFDENNFLKEEKFSEIDIFIEKATILDSNFKVYDDALEFIIDKRAKENRKKIINKLFPEEKDNTKAFKSYVNADLYPYQQKGVLFALKAGRVLIADDMGLGKTIQAITTAEILKTHFGVGNILIIAPTSLKYQWYNEIKKFTNNSTIRVIEGNLDKRKHQYKTAETYKIASYGVALNDIDYINASDFDLVILDEAQKIKNWQTKTAQNLKKLKSEYAIVITGTPLENKIEELHSIVEFIDPFRLGALFRFLDKHQIKDSSGKVIGYDNLNDISKALDGILLRRTKQEIKKQLPERIDKNYFIDITKEQEDIHSDYQYIVNKLISKWRRFGFLSEKDRQRLLIALGSMRMVSDTTYILDQKTNYGKKIDQLIKILNDIFENTDNKVVIFSQWERMTRLVSRELKKMNIDFEYLHGGIPSIKRKELINNFNNDLNKKVFLSTDAGGVGLNLQTANIVINIDLPWNPAVLEQRIGRVHRLGQQQIVQVINLVSKGTIEHRILDTLRFKKSTFDGVLDGGENMVMMGENKFTKFIKAVEELNDEEINEYIEDYNHNDKKEEKKKEKEEKIPVNEETKTEELTQTKEKYNEPEKQNNINTRSKSDKKQEVDEMFTSGIDFLGKLGNVFNKLQTGEISVNDFVEKNEKTGQTTLKIPIKDAESVVNTINSIASLFNAIKK